MGAFGSNYGGNYGISTIIIPTKTVTASLCVTTNVKSNQCITTGIKAELCV